LPRLTDLVELAAQRFDYAASRLSAGLSANIAAHAQHLTATTARMTPGLLSRPVALRTDRLAELQVRLTDAAQRRTRLAEDRADLTGLMRRSRVALMRRLETQSQALERLDQLRRSLDPDRPLALGFARIHAADGALVRSAAALSPGDAVQLVFADGAKGAHIDGDVARPRKAPAAPPKAGAADQGSLF